MRYVVGTAAALTILTWATAAAAQDKEAKAAQQLAERGATIRRADDRPGKPVVEVVLKNDDDETLDLLASLGSLETLDLRGSAIIDPGLAKLKPLGKLRTLILARCEQISDEGLKHVAALTALETLSLNDTKIG